MQPSQKKTNSTFYENNRSLHLKIIISDGFTYFEVSGIYLRSYRSQSATCVDRNGSETVTTGHSHEFYGFLNDIQRPCSQLGSSIWHLLFYVAIYFFRLTEQGPELFHQVQLKIGLQSCQLIGFYCCFQSYCYQMSIIFILLAAFCIDSRQLFTISAITCLYFCNHEPIVLYFIECLKYILRNAA